jgi:hypothetical protein
VTAALAKVLRWLGAPLQACNQFWGRYEEWRQGGGGAMRTFLVAYSRLAGAVCSARQDDAVSVLRDVWGVNM